MPSDFEQACTAWLKANTFFKKGKRQHNSLGKQYYIYDIDGKKVAIVMHAYFSRTPYRVDPCEQFVASFTIQNCAAGIILLPPVCYVDESVDILIHDYRKSNIYVQYFYMCNNDTNALKTSIIDDFYNTLLEKIEEQEEQKISQNEESKEEQEQDEQGINQNELKEEEEDEHESTQNEESAVQMAIDDNQSAQSACVQDSTAIICDNNQNISVVTNSSQHEMFDIKIAREHSLTPPSTNSYIFKRLVSRFNSDVNEMYLEYDRDTSGIDKVEGTHFSDVATHIQRNMKTHRYDSFILHWQNQGCCVTDDIYYDVYDRQQIFIKLYHFYDVDKFCQTLNNTPSTDLPPFVSRMAIEKIRMRASRQEYRAELEPEYKKHIMKKYFVPFAKVLNVVPKVGSDDDDDQSSV